MGILSDLGKLIENVFELIFSVLGALIEAAIWAVGFVIDLAADILGWINKTIKNIFFPQGGTDHVISGPAFKRFLDENNETKNFTEIDLNTLNKSIIHVVEKNGTQEIVADQMIKSQSGLNDATRSQFQGKNEIRIKIPVS